MESYIKRKKSDNLIDMTITDPNINLNNHMISRTVVRGISIKDNKILLVYPKNNVIYGTPGGGVDEGEGLVEALKREMLEEVGAKSLEVVKYLGIMKSYRKDFGSDSVFSPTHHYYLVNILETKEPELVPYEAALELTNEYIDIDEAIKQNESRIKQRNIKFLDFYTNQTILLKELKNLLF